MREPLHASLERLKPSCARGLDRTDNSGHGEQERRRQHLQLVGRDGAHAMEKRVPAFLHDEARTRKHADASVHELVLAPPKDLSRRGRARARVAGRTRARCTEMRG
eukprot:31123-Pleurochrysis_carterae.AAC.1